MTADTLSRRLQEVAREVLPTPGRGATHRRLERLWEVGLEDLSLAKLAEAHWDAVAILDEAQRIPQVNAVYAVWASENKNQPLNIINTGDGTFLTGVKSFCSGIGLVDCALITVGDQLIQVDLCRHPDFYSTDTAKWTTDAFRLTNTGSIRFNNYPLSDDDLVGESGWYTRRIGFWHGACNPAACWAGGAEGLVLFAEKSSRDDAHTTAHLGAMRSSIWAMKAILRVAAEEIDYDVQSSRAAMVRSLKVRHLIEQSSTDILRRLVRAYGPYPLVMDDPTSHRYAELDLYLRQTHGERDLELLGRS